jgi:transposase
MSFLHQRETRNQLILNATEPFARIMANCLIHGRRQFVDIIEHFPQECSYVSGVLAQIYAHDAHARDESMTPAQRLLYHQSHSDAPMQAMQQWMNDQFDKKQVEPNSALGGALRYMLKHWNALTLFLRVQGPPLDNNICNAAGGISSVMPRPKLCRVEVM